MFVDYQQREKGSAQHFSGLPPQALPEKDLSYIYVKTQLMLFPLDCWHDEGVYCEMDSPVYLANFEVKMVVRAVASGRGIP